MYFPLFRLEFLEYELSDIEFNIYFIPGILHTGYTAKVFYCKLEKRAKATRGGKVTQRGTRRICIANPARHFVLQMWRWLCFMIGFNGVAVDDSGVAIDDIML